MELIVLVGGIFVFCVAGCFFCSLRQISRCRFDVETAARQLSLYRSRPLDGRNESDATLRQRQIEVSETIYQDAIATYYRAIRKPRNAISVFFLDFREKREDAPTEEKKERTETKNESFNREE